MSFSARGIKRDASAKRREMGWDGMGWDEGRRGKDAWNDAASVFLCSLSFISV